ncbi:phenazine antibiotic biosynthesis protein [Nocardia sp. NEAU-G5]|uniref:Phenazine antibiotic biosynthesis protein n=1 Tax=Nocardia albiluteola TaxID=2842303 RepID=A0ABS6BCT6_9NOCA|nr:phenazine antibiotic biosynthesis protein [Nocardia albiluteola]MBU3068097.1 phenazine antibiotic biosynthesis protein [Nocardia albiluteola]
MTTTVEDQRWQLLDPSIDPADPDEYLRTAIRWHFGADTGAPFWLRRMRQLDFDPLSDIRTFEDLRRFPNIVDELRTVAVEDLVPRGYGPNPPAPRVFESGGTTGAPKRAILMPDWISSAVDRMLRGPQFEGREPSNILVLTPTGPHKIGSMYDYIAERQNTIKFCIDMDPRWVKKLVADNRSDQAAAYVQHILDQADHILATQRVGLVVTTPPVLRAIIHRPRLVELINTKVDLIFWGGAHMTVDERFMLRHEYFSNVRMISRYGSLMILESATERPGSSADEDIIYDPRSPVVTFGVIDPATGRPVDYGERGQIVMNHVSKGMFLPNNLERDTVIRVRGRTGQIGDSVSSPAPVETFGGEMVIEGVY